MRRRRSLSLNEWAVLGVLVDRPRHGYDVATELRRDTELGDVWRLTRPVVYRALERLEALGLAEPSHSEPGEGGPPRTVYRPTPTGDEALRSWLDEPVAHLRDVRSALLLKLVLLERLGRPRATLVTAQRAAFADHIDALTEHSAAEASIDPGVAALWRQHSASAVSAFLDALDEER